MFHQSSKQILLGVAVALFLTMPAYAVKNFKVSNFGGGHQIWFQAEDYDERNPDTNAYYPVVDQAGAFGKAITRTGSAGGMIRWTFDISAAGGKGGTWYFWGRVINPGNTSDYMLVKGDPHDTVIPSGPPFPGSDGTAPFVNANDRIFEETDGPPWTWCISSHTEGHTKVLQNGVNNMYIFHRQGDSTVFWDVFMWTDNANYVPTDADFQKATTPIMGSAFNPSPADATTDVPRDVVLSWVAGKYPGTHDVYLGTTLADVNSASRTSPKGVLASKGQTDATFDPPGSLAYGQTYYWRIDEVNKSADGTIFKSPLWSFTVEPYAYPLTQITATASSSQAGSGPENTINGSGLTGDLHGTDSTTMWLSTGVAPNWIQYQFDAVYMLNDLKVWNSNQTLESFIGFGAKDVKIEYSTDGTTWTTLPNVPQFARAPGVAGYAANTTVSFGGVMAKYVKLTINSNWGGISPAVSLSEVRFSYVPVQARAPQPANNAGNVGLTPTLAWRPGRLAGSHKVYFGTNQAAVAAGTAPAQTLTEHTFAPGALTYGTMYYWRVDEVNTVTYPGDVWTFTTQPFQTVDDFESYDDDNNRIYQTWIDGATDGKSGSYVGYNPTQAQLNAGTGHFAETTIVNSGKQSMPLAYDNTKAPFYSETTRDLGTPQDWTSNGATHLSLWYRGYPAPTSFTVNATAGGTAMSLTGDGSDIWNASDDFVYAYKTLSGDGSIVARVVSIGAGTNTWAKGGVMIRDSLNGGSGSAQTCLTANSDGTAGNGACFQNRASTNLDMSANDATSNTTATTVIKPPYWVKVTRTGDSFAGFISANGTTWTQLGTAKTIPMTAPVYIGICVTAHQAGEQRTFQFDNITTTGNVTGSWQGAQISSPQYNDPAGLYVVVTDSSGKSKLMAHPDPAAAATGAWTQWTIPLSDLTAAGVKTNKVQKLTIGVGDKANPKAGGIGLLFIDDIQFGKPFQWAAQPGEILIEAESATTLTAPFSILSDPQASGGKYITTPTSAASSSSGPTTGVATYSFTVAAGVYKVWFRTGPILGGSNDSFWVRIKDATIQTPGNSANPGWIRDNNLSVPPNMNTWHWVVVWDDDNGDTPVQFTLSAGTHTLEVAYREQAVPLDAIIITSNLN